MHPPPGSLVIDLGAGSGALTGPLARRGARVIAGVLDPRWARTLGDRARAWGEVEVVRADALRVPFPGEPFHVVSAAPYGIGTRLVRRLLTDAHGLVRAVVVLQLETARRLAGRPHAGRFAATWAPWFELTVGPRIDRRAFRPVPNVDSAVLTIAPRRRPLLSPAAFGAYDAFLGELFRGRAPTLGARLARRVGRRRATAAIQAAGLDARWPPSRVPPDAYAALFTIAAGGLTSRAGSVSHSP